jgi:hypothetical protein
MQLALDPAVARPPPSEIMLDSLNFAATYSTLQRGSGKLVAEEYVHSCRAKSWPSKHGGRGQFQLACQFRELHPGAGSMDSVVIRLALTISSSAMPQ